MFSSVSHVANSLGPSSELGAAFTAMIDVFFEVLALVASLALANALAP